ncbi:MAG: response regulator [Gammaproteobacteria bacterium]|nr:response regulator [Gammaproteobacteria bacterium]
MADDSHDNAESCALLLRLSGHDVHTAHSGGAALELAGTVQPQAVLLDIGMPELNGYEVARSIRAQPWGERALLIAITGWGQEEDRQRAIDAGFDHHLTKPVDPGELELLLGDFARMRASVPESH